MKVLKIMIVMLVLIMSVGAVFATDDISNELAGDGQDTLEITQDNVYATGESSFSNLADEIENADKSLDLSHNYAFSNESDNKTGIAIGRDNFVINGNGYAIDANNQSRIFDITGNNVTLSNLILMNGNAEKGGAIYSTGSLTLNNVTFINNYASYMGGAIWLYGDVVLNCNNSKFIDNYADLVSSIYAWESKLNLYNIYFTSRIFSKTGQILATANAEVYMENATFFNITSSYSPAAFLVDSKTRIVNSRFINLKAHITAGAMNIMNGGELYIKNCEFINTSASKNAGAIYVDIAGMGDGEGNVSILDTIFKDTYSEFGGSYVQLDGQLLLNNTCFINNHASCDGGAIYLSFTDTEINNCTFDSNGVRLTGDYSAYGGAIFSDMAVLNISNSKFLNNVAAKGNAVYAYDTSYNIRNSLFKNNTNPINTVFDKESILENNTYINDDNVSTNNTFYPIMTGQGLELALINNTIDIVTLPSKFDLRDWGWMSPVRDQGFTGTCWTFAMSGALESALLKATGREFNISMNNMKNMLRYSRYGCCDLMEGGHNLASSGYLVSWLGAIPYDEDIYDELGKITQIITNRNIHVQDIIFVPNNEIPYGTQFKETILKYGSLDVSFFEPYDDEMNYYNPQTYAQYVNESMLANHEVAIIGWDDNFSKEKFLITPPGDGAWIIKNSYGPESEDNGCMYISYYDQSLLYYTPGNLTFYAATAIFENTVPYNKNYQHDVAWLSNFEPGNGTIGYMNVFESLENDAIAAVGTYFNQSGVSYTVEIYVNDELKLTQDGTSPFAGYHTIKLNEYIPVKKGDIFKAKITSNFVPYVLLEETRMHYTKNMSFVCKDGQNWEDAYDLGYMACLKVYTVALSIYTQDLVKIYKNDSKFEANIGAAYENVTFEINGVNYTRISDENGTARITINLNPGNYTIKTTYNNNTVENSITVLPTLIAENLVKYYRNASQFDIVLIDGEGKAVAGKNITMNINGVLYTPTTNENGTARLNINLPPGEYILTAIDPLTGLQMSYNITVLPVLNATDITMKYLDGTKFKVNLVDSQGNPYKNQFVRFNINGKFYDRLTDSNGQAALNIRLPPGEYIITSSFNGSNIANKITITG